MRHLTLTITVLVIALFYAPACPILMSVAQANQSLSLPTGGWAPTPTPQPVGTAGPGSTTPPPTTTNPPTTSTPPSSTAPSSPFSFLSGGSSWGLLKTVALVGGVGALAGTAAWAVPKGVNQLRGQDANWNWQGGGYAAAGGVAGGVVGGLAGGMIASAIAGKSQNGAPNTKAMLIGAGVGFVVGAILGGLLGGRYGDKKDEAAQAAQAGTPDPDANGKPTTVTGGPTVVVAPGTVTVAQPSQPVTTTPPTGGMVGGLSTIPRVSNP